MEKRFELFFKKDGRLIEANISCTTYESALKEAKYYVSNNPNQVIFILETKARIVTGEPVIQEYK